MHANTPGRDAAEGDLSEDEKAKEPSVDNAVNLDKKTDLYTAVGAAANAAAAAAMLPLRALNVSMRSETAESGASRQEQGSDVSEQVDQGDQGAMCEDELVEEGVPLPSQVLNNAMKALGSDAAQAVGDRAKPPWTPAERQLANKANCIWDANMEDIAKLIPSRRLGEVAAYVAELPKPQVQRARRAPILEPLKEGSAANLSGPGGQTSYTRPFGSRGSSKSKKQRMESTMHTLAILRKQERLGVKHEYRPCTCALMGRRCSEETCECIKANNFCEKYCACSGPLGGCGNGFPGCGCRKTECRSVGCPCWDAFRECDADVCTCGASGMLEEFDKTFQDNVAMDAANDWDHEFRNNPAACWRHRYDKHLPPRLFTKRQQEVVVQGPGARVDGKSEEAAAMGAAAVNGRSEGKEAADGGLVRVDAARQGADVGAAPVAARGQ